MRYKVIVFLFLFFMIACGGKEQPLLDTVAYENEINTWHEKRVAELKGVNGWLNVVGLFWLKEGINTFGSDGTNAIVFPKGKIAGQAGFFLVQNGVVTVQTLPEANIRCKGERVERQIIFHPDSAKAEVLETGPLQWFIIKRDNLLGVRLRDLESEALKKFTSIERYPVDASWRLKATLEMPSEKKVLSVANVLGQRVEQVSPGTLVFTWKGKTYRLDALEGNEDEFFMIMGDQTNGIETYGSGRYMYVKKPGPDGKIILDFNKAYNPPCAFTAHATCLLPPEQNRLPFEIIAGEKNYGDHH
ncbi:MAG: DUF1684 domain-containing protein [Cyclobacteriaceae bacterium]|nr:DUF1684 domain-containing protein [Cyclobacteriaceae bacterium]